MESRYLSGLSKDDDGKRSKGSGGRRRRKSKGTDKTPKGKKDDEGHHPKGLHFVKVKDIRTNPYYVRTKELKLLEEAIADLTSKIKSTDRTLSSMTEEDPYRAETEKILQQYKVAYMRVRGEYESRLAEFNGELAIENEKYWKMIKGGKEKEDHEEDSEGLENTDEEEKEDARVYFEHFPEDEEEFDVLEQ